MYFVTTQELIQKAYSLDLEGVQILDKYSIAEIADVRIYNRVLDAAEIQQIYEA